MTELIKNVNELEKILSAPSDDLIEYMSGLEGDIAILGAAGKMGPSLAKLAKNALKASGKSNRVIAVSRFSSEQALMDLNGADIETLRGDLLNKDFLAGLPDAYNMIYMAGLKFGSTGNPGLTWAMNTHLPSLVSEKFSDSRIVALSTGNVYAFSAVSDGGCTEKDPTNPVGEYAQSCLGRERMFEYFSKLNSTPVCLIRLNYAVETRYGVLVDVATKVFNNEPVDVTMGYANVIWQGDANAMILRALDHCKSPAAVLNITGPEILSIRWLAEQFAALMNKDVEIVGKEADTALLNDASKAFSLFGSPHVELNTIIEWTADWIMNHKPMLNKPTHFETRSGKF